MQPGQTLPPNNPDSSLSPVVGAPSATEQPVSTSSVDPTLSSAPVPQAASMPAVASSTSPEAQWLVTNEDSGPHPTPLQPQDISWSAAEFTGHQKSASWYVIVMLSGIVMAALDYIFVKDVISTCLIVLVTFGGIIYSSHKPRAESYRLTSRGIQIGGKLYGFQQFKNFSVTMDGAVANIIFMPLGRVALPITVSVPQDVEDKVFDYLSLFLPFEPHHNDALDGLLRKMKF